MKVLKTILEYALIIIIVLLIRNFVFARVRVDGNSMNNTLHNDDIMILNIIKYKLNDPKRFEIVVFKYKDEPLIKRVIGLPGDTVAYINGRLILNGKKISESYIDKNNNDTSDDFSEITVPKGKYFVMGDNRDNSLDSRFIGLIDRSDILGNANFIIYPFNRFGNATK